MSSDAQVEQLVTVVDGRTHLVGSRCESCPTTSFPRQTSCSRCGSSMVEQTLPATGTVWSWTVQRIAVKAPYAGPQPFEPFAVGYVDLGPLKVETPLFGHPVDGWSIGEAVELAAGDEHPYLPFWFRPTAGGHQ